MAGRRFSRGELTAVAFSLAIMAIFPVALIATALHDHGYAWLRIFRQRVPLDWSIARVIVGGVGVAFLGLLIRYAIPLRKAWREAAPTRRQIIEMSLGEPVKWRGRPGFRSFGRERAIMLPLVLSGIVPLGLALSWVWTSMAFAPELSLFRAVFSGAFLMIFGPMAIWPVWHLMTRDNRWLCELVGEVLVTDRRILWTLHNGSIAQVVPAEKLVAAELIERNGDRGWISLRIRRASLVEDDYELRGVPDPDAALAAMRRLIRSF